MVNIGERYPSSHCVFLVTFLRVRNFSKEKIEENMNVITALYFLIDKSVPRGIMQVRTGHIVEAGASAPVQSPAPTGT